MPAARAHACCGQRCVGTEDRGATIEAIRTLASLLYVQG